MALAAKGIANGVVCLISALSYYQLTDEIPRQHWIAIPHKAGAIRRHGVRVVRMRNIRLGRKPLRLGRLLIKIFDRERCVVDAFRYLGPEVAIKALRAYLRDRKHKSNIRKLTGYSKALHVEIKPYLLSETT